MIGLQIFVWLLVLLGYYVDVIVCADQLYSLWTVPGAGHASECWRARPSAAEGIEG
jgi:hypothetical protein